MPVLPRAKRLTISRFDEALDESAGGCDLRNLMFIDAYGLVGTACALRSAMTLDPELPIRAPSSPGTRAHLTAMGLGKFLADAGRPESLPVEPPSEAFNVVVPLRDATDAGGPQALSNLLWAQLRDQVDPSVLQAIGEGVWEMVGNALEHSGSAALVMGQVYAPTMEACRRITTTGFKSSSATQDKASGARSWRPE